MQATSNTLRVAPLAFILPALQKEGDNSFASEVALNAKQVWKACGFICGACGPRAMIKPAAKRTLAARTDLSHQALLGEDNLLLAKKWSKVGAQR